MELHSGVGSLARKSILLSLQTGRVVLVYIPPSAPTLTKPTCDLYRTLVCPGDGASSGVLRAGPSGISEEHSYRFAYHYRNQIDIPLPEVPGGRYTRFDPDVRPVVCCEFTDEITPTNSAGRLEDSLAGVSLTVDPQYSGRSIRRLSFARRSQQCGAAAGIGSQLVCLSGQRFFC